MGSIIQWYQKHTGVTHALAGVITFLMTAYFQLPAFHDFVTKYYGMLPQSAKQIVAMLIVLYGFYRQSYKPVFTEEKVYHVDDKPVAITTTETQTK